jgi:hypothetical protein
MQHVIEQCSISSVAENQSEKDYEDKLLYLLDIGIELVIPCDKCFACALCAR